MSDIQPIVHYNEDDDGFVVEGKELDYVVFGYEMNDNDEN